MMTEKRYSYSKSPITGLYVICDGKHRETFSGLDDKYNCSRIVRKLNILTDENEQLKKQLQNIKEYIDNSIEKNKEAIEWGKNTGAGIGAMGFYTHMLEKMKKDWFE